MRLLCQPLIAEGRLAVDQLPPTGLMSLSNCSSSKNWVDEAAEVAHCLAGALELLVQKQPQVS